MASVRLDFVRPSVPGLAQLKIYEATSKEGEFTSIESVTAIGTYPDYISYYTTESATSKTNWFAIEWVDTDGASSGLSAAIQGGTESLVGEITSRVLLRDPTIDEMVATQEAEAVVSSYFSVMNPYTVDPDEASPTVMSGLTLLALALSQLYITATSTGDVQKFTAGLIAMDKGSSSTTQRKIADIEALIKLANKMLGQNYSVIAQLEEIEVAGGYTQLVAVDLTRAIIEVQ